MPVLVLLGAIILSPTACDGGTEPSTPTGGEEILLFEIRTRGGEEFQYRVSQAALDSTLSWDPLDDEPPLAPHEAARVAASHAKADALETIVVVRLELGAVRSDLDGKRRWYYAVSFYDRDQAYEDEPPEIQQLVILMDGSVIERSRKTR